MTKEYLFRVPIRGYRYVAVNAENVQAAKDIVIWSTHQNYEDQATDLYLDQMDLIEVDSRVPEENELISFDHDDEDNVGY